MSVFFLPAILGPEMAAPLLWAPGILWLFLLENPHADKIAPLGGAGVLGFFRRGGGSADFIFTGAGIFLIRRSKRGKPDTKSLAQICDPKCVLQRPGTSKLPKGCRRCFGVCGVDKKAVALVKKKKKRVALVQDKVALAQETRGRPFLQLAKTPLAPSPNHFGQ